jgi:hypothetical protein
MEISGGKRISFERRIKIENPIVMIKTFPAFFPHFLQRRMSWIFKMFCFVACLGVSLFPNYATANASENRECSAFHIKNFEKLTQADMRHLILRDWMSNWGYNLDENDKKLEINKLRESHKFRNKNARKVRYYSAVIWPEKPIPDTESYVILYEDGDYEINGFSFAECYWRILLPTEFAKNDFKKLDKSTLQKIISNHVKSRGLHPDTYRVKEFTLKKQGTKGQKEIYFWEVLNGGEESKYQFEKHYFLIYEEKPLDAENSLQGNPVKSNKAIGKKNTGKDEKKPK